jgi:hypothetical protein
MVLRGRKYTRPCSVADQRSPPRCDQERPATATRAVTGLSTASDGGRVGGASLRRGRCGASREMKPGRMVTARSSPTLKTSMAFSGAAGPMLRPDLRDYESDEGRESEVLGYFLRCARVLAQQIRDQRAQAGGIDRLVQYRQAAGFGVPQPVGSGVAGDEQSRDLDIEFVS